MKRTLHDGSLFIDPSKWPTTAHMRRGVRWTLTNKSVAKAPDNVLTRIISLSREAERGRPTALVFLYSEVLKQEFEWLLNLERAKKPERLPVVLTESEVRHVLAHLDGRNWLMASLVLHRLWGSITTDT